MNNKEYQKWIESYVINPDIKEQLFLMDQKELEEAFASEIEFGTAGIRAKIGPGSNRMNHYVVAKVTLGYINYLKDHFTSIYEKGIVIAYDNRKFSQEFAGLVANLMAANNIKVYLFEDLRPTPQLSFFIKYFNACGGINITASHNNKDYNGYKVYDQNGCQILVEEADLIKKYIENVHNELELDLHNFKHNDNLIHILGDTYDDIFIDVILDKMINKNLEYRSFPIIYTGLHGTGSQVIPKLLAKAGFSHVFNISEQLVSDPEFTTVPNPNPESLEAYDLAIQKAHELNIDYILASDPDADRIGVCVRKDYEFKLLTGNELGALLLNYILKERNKQNLLQENSLMIDTIVTSDLGKMIAAKYQLYNLSVLTGFKYIGSLINEFENTKEFKYEFGYEESLGYLIDPYIADKDAVSTSLVICEMINYYQIQNLSLLDVLEQIYHEYGYYLNKQISITLDSKFAKKRIDDTMNYFSNLELESIGNIDIVAVEDYNKQLRYSMNEQVKIMLPQANVIKLFLANDSWIAIRPSGTEPKIKIYLQVKRNSFEASKEQMEVLQNDINTILEEIYT
ncbi:MAG: phospho-sugar mutase [Mycoplasmataceae bacterium]|nr:phospho-sugar mutase [Mycoplasmataceae bacterium]